MHLDDRVWKTFRRALSGPRFRRVEDAAGSMKLCPSWTPVVRRKQSINEGTCKPILADMEIPTLQVDVGVKLTPMSCEWVLFSQIDNASRPRTIVHSLQQLACSQASRLSQVKALTPVIRCVLKLSGISPPF